MLFVFDLGCCLCVSFVFDFLFCVHRLISVVGRVRVCVCVLYLVCALLFMGLIVVVCMCDLILLFVRCRYDSMLVVACVCVRFCQSCVVVDVF